MSKKKKKNTKKTKKRPIGRTTTPVPPAANREPAPPEPRTGTDAPDKSVTAAFKAGRDL